MILQPLCRKLRESQLGIEVEINGEKGASFQRKGKEQEGGKGGGAGAGGVAGM